MNEEQHLNNLFYLCGVISKCKVRFRKPLFYFEYDNTPVRNWRKLVCLGYKTHERGIVEIKYVYSPTWDSKELEIMVSSEEELRKLWEAKNNLLNERDIPKFKFNTVFCACHSHEEYEETLSESNEKGGLIECGYGFAGCNGYFHKKCCKIISSRGNSPEEGIYVCPLCTRYLSYQPVLDTPGIRYIYCSFINQEVARSSSDMTSAQFTCSSTPHDAYGIASLSLSSSGGKKALKTKISVPASAKASKTKAPLPVQQTPVVETQRVAPVNDLNIPSFLKNHMLFRDASNIPAEPEPSSMSFNLFSGVPVSRVPTVSNNSNSTFASSGGVLPALTPDNNASFPSLVSPPGFYRTATLSRDDYMNIPVDEEANTQRSSTVGHSDEIQVKVNFTSGWSKSCNDTSGFDNCSKVLKSILTTRNCSRRPVQMNGGSVEQNTNQLFWEDRADLEFRQVFEKLWRYGDINQRSLYQFWLSYAGIRQELALFPNLDDSQEAQMNLLKKKLKNKPFRISSRAITNLNESFGSLSPVLVDNLPLNDKQVFINARPPSGAVCVGPCGLPTDLSPLLLAVNCFPGKNSKTTRSYRCNNHVALEIPTSDGLDCASTLCGWCLQGMECNFTRNDAYYVYPMVCPECFGRKKKGQVQPHMCYSFHKYCYSALNNTMTKKKMESWFEKAMFQKFIIDNKAVEFEDLLVNYYDFSFKECDFEVVGVQQKFHCDLCGITGGVLQKFLISPRYTTFVKYLHEENDQKVETKYWFGHIYCLLWLLRSELLFCEQSNEENSSPIEVVVVDSEPERKPDELIMESAESEDSDEDDIIYSGYRRISPRYHASTVANIASTLTSEVSAMDYVRSSVEDTRSKPLEQYEDSKNIIPYVCSFKRRRATDGMSYLESKNKFDINFHRYSCILCGSDKGICVPCRKDSLLDNMVGKKCLLYGHPLCIRLAGWFM